MSPFDEVRRKLPKPAGERLRQSRATAARVLTLGELERLRAEIQEEIERRTRDVLERQDTVLSGYDRRVAAVVDRLVALEDRVATGGPDPSAIADRVLAAHGGAAAFRLDPDLAAAFLEAQAEPWDEVVARVGRYVSAIGEDRPVLDVGSGRGELLSVLRDEGIAASGVDANPVLVAKLAAAGLEARAEDELVHLAGCGDASVGAVTAMGFLERLDLADADRFLREVRRVLRPGGVLVVELLDPDLLGAAKALWRDPTRVRLYHPSALELLCRNAGLQVLETVGVDADRYSLVATRP